jgi:hypothetical protein
MKYKLATLPRGTSKMPVLGVPASVELKQGESLSITPQTLNYLGNTTVYESSGYNYTISDVRTMSTFEGIGITTATSANLNATQTLGTNVWVTATIQGSASSFASDIVTIRELSVDGALTFETNSVPDNTTVHFHVIYIPG